MSDDTPERFPVTLAVKWCPDCGMSDQRVAFRDAHFTSCGARRCPGSILTIIYAPVMDVRQAVAQAAAEAASTGNAGDVLISAAMYQALGVIDRSYPVHVTPAPGTAGGPDA